MDLIMYEFIIWIVLSIPIAVISRRSLLHITSHGFYRFLAWECILWLIIVNIKYWYTDPFCLAQIFSWIFLFCSIFLLIPAVRLMKKMGKPKENRSDIPADSTLYAFEKTSELIQTGIFKYIRHPMYGSLLFLTWGVCLKNPELTLILISILSTIFLYVTAKTEEKEDIKYFGDEYRKYIKKSKMFVPYIL
jgi:protein-S-isoprenylcysteine O-methyltransferase Ste14